MHVNEALTCRPAEDSRIKEGVQRWLQQNNRIIQAWSRWARCSHSLSYFLIMRSVSCKWDSSHTLSLSAHTHTHTHTQQKKSDYSHSLILVCVFSSHDFLLPSIHPAIFPFPSWKLFKLLQSLEDLTMQIPFGVTYSITLLKDKLLWHSCFILQAYASGICLTKCLVWMC